jgi:hypothetical protein
MILDSLLPFYKKERINYHAELESNKIEYQKVLSEVKEKMLVTLENVHDKDKIKEIKKFFNKEFDNLKRKYKESKFQSKINFMSAVSKTKEREENIKLTKKSKSNLHQMLFKFAKLPYEEKKNSLVVMELSPSREAKMSIKKRVFGDLNAFKDSNDDRVYAAEKDILFMNIEFGTGNEKIPMVIRYSGECVPIFLEKIRDDTFDKFSSENEHHIMLLSERLREIKAPGSGIKLNKFVVMGGIIVVLMIAYFGYKYYTGG